MVFYRLFIVTIAVAAVSNHSAAISHRMSLTLKPTGVGNFGVKYGAKGDVRRKPSFNTIWKKH